MGFIGRMVRQGAVVIEAEEDVDNFGGGLSAAEAFKFGGSEPDGFEGTFVGESIEDIGDADGLERGRRLQYCHSAKSCQSNPAPSLFTPDPCPFFALGR